MDWTSSKIQTVEQTDQEVIDAILKTGNKELFWVLHDRYVDRDGEKVIIPLAELLNNRVVILEDVRTTNS